MERKRRGYRESEGGAATVSLGAPVAYITPRKRSASLGDAEKTLAEREKPSGPTVATEPMDAPVRWRGNPMAAADLTLGLHDGEDDTSAVARLLGNGDWRLEQNLPKEVFLPTLLRAYDNVHARYTRTKARKMDIEAQFEEQRRSHERFQQVADGYIHDLCTENQELRKTLEAADKRMKWLESLYLKCQEDEARARDRTAAESQKDREADVAASPTEGEPPQAEEQQLPPDQVRQPRTEEVAECHVETNVAQESLGREIVVAQENGSQVVAQEGPTENALNVEPLPETPLENARCLEDSAAAELDKAMVAFPDPIMIESRPHSNEAKPQGEELHDVHLMEVELQDEQQHREIEFQDLYRREVLLQALHRKEVELEDQHRKEVAGLLSELEILQRILGHFIEMSVVSDEVARRQRGKPALILFHPLTGFRFRLEICKEPEAQEEELEVSYRNLSLGTLVKVAPWWMREEIVFTVDQLVNFMSRFQETVTGCKT